MNQNIKTNKLKQTKTNTSCLKYNYWTGDLVSLTRVYNNANQPKYGDAKIQGQKWNGEQKLFDETINNYSPPNRYFNS